MPSGGRKMALTESEMEDDGREIIHDRLLGGRKGAEPIKVGASKGNMSYAWLTVRTSETVVSKRELRK